MLPERGSHGILLHALLIVYELRSSAPEASMFIEISGKEVESHGEILSGLRAADFPRAYFRESGRT